MSKVSRKGGRKRISDKSIEYKISDNEKVFCELYTNDPELRGNGIRAYAEAFSVNIADPKNYNFAKVNACKLLSKPNVLNYIKSIFEQLGLNDTEVMGELLFVIKQNADFGSKVAAIKLYCELNGKIKKHEQTQMNFLINIGNQETKTQDATFKEV